jgi:hypothetical protein
MPCKGICIHHKASGRYITGHKRCKNCDVFIKWEGLCCPCCGHKLRTGPRPFRLKEKLREQKRIEQVKKSSNIVSSAECLRYQIFIKK